MASVSGLSAFGEVFFAGDGLVTTGGFLSTGGGVFGLTDVAPCAGSTCGVGTGDLTRSGEGVFFTAALIGADFFATGFFETAFFATDVFTAGFFAAAFVLAIAGFFDVVFAAFLAAGMVAFFAVAFFTVAFFAEDFFTDAFLAAAAAGFFVADFAAVAGFFFFFATTASFDLADLLALVDLAVADLPAAFFVAGLAVDAFGFGDERFMVNSYGRWTGLRMPCERIQRERMA